MSSVNDEQLCEKVEDTLLDYKQAKWKGREHITGQQTEAKGKGREHITGLQTEAKWKGGEHITGLQTEAKWRTP